MKQINILEMEEGKLYWCRPMMYPLCKKSRTIYQVTNIKDSEVTKTIGIEKNYNDVVNLMVSLGSQDIDPVVTPIFTKVLVSDDGVEWYHRHYAWYNSMDGIEDRYHVFEVSEDVTDFGATIAYRYCQVLLPSPSIIFERHASIVRPAKPEEIHVHYVAPPEDVAVSEPYSGNIHFDQKLTDAAMATKVNFHKAPVTVNFAEGLTKLSNEDIDFSKNLTTLEKILEK